jgi:phosphatidylglycerophosphatase A
MADQQPVVPWAAPGGAGANAAADALAGADFELHPEAVYRPATTRATIAMGLVAVATFLYAVDGLLSLYGIQLLANLAETTDAELVAYDELVGLVAIGSFGVFIAAAIASWLWLYRLVQNVPALGGGTPSVTPGWAVGWWFIPFANLFKPYQVVKDAWQRLALSAVGNNARRVLAWWLLWIIGNIGANLLGRLPVPQSIDAFNSQAVLNVIVDALIVAAGILFVLIIREFERRSQARLAALPIRAAQEAERQAEADAAVARATAAVEASRDAARIEAASREPADTPPAG